MFDVEIKRLEQVEKIVNLTKITANKAQDQLKIIIEVINNIKDSVLYTSQAAMATSHELTLQSAKVASSKVKLSMLLRELENSRKDLEDTKEAARKAQIAAHTAKNNLKLISIMKRK